MKKIIRASERFFNDYGDVKSYFLFSFANYLDPKNMNWGQLRVFNDDFIAVWAGFPTHPHRHFEIITIMLSGTITHQDSLWNKEKIHPSEIQVTNTWSGISHSEFNEDSEDIELYQIWFSPKKEASEPIYYTAKYEPKDFENTLCTLVSWLTPSQHTLVSDAMIQRWVFDAGEKLEIDTQHYVFLYVTSGMVQIEDVELRKKDQLRIKDEWIIQLTFLEKTEILIISTL